MVNQGQLMSKNEITRPALDDALEAWKKCLAENHLPPEPLWIFAENLCIEPSRTAPEELHFAFQTKFTPPDEDALEITYDYFSETNARMVFYRLGSYKGKSVCILLCDPWFDTKKANDGFLQLDEWKMSFHPGHAGDIEEVTDLTRWVRRVKRIRALHDFDFSMALETIDQIKLHGRPLMPYERMADKMLNRLRRMFGQID
jgi:hypothetical protein